MAGADDVNSTLQNVGRNIGLIAQSVVNSFPAASTTSSPQSTPINNLSTAAVTVIGVSTIRHGLLFHNPGGTTSIYVFPSLTSTAPTTSSVGGAFQILPAGTLSFPGSQYPNINCAWSAFAGTGTNQPLTVVEFF